MASAIFRFYEELNDFLPQEKRKVSFPHHFAWRASVKDMIESLGVPHTEIELILANGVSVDFSYIVKDGDRVAVYPVFECFDVSPLVRLREQPLRRSRFVLDSHLGRLARYLRLLGLDTLYRNDYTDAELAALSHDTHRILLTRDCGLLKRSMVTHGYFVRQTDPRRQLGEILSRFDLYTSIREFGRCIRCNGRLDPVEKETIAHRLASDTRSYYDRFWTCRDCEQIYWQGSHYEKMRKLVDEILEEGRNCGADDRREMR